MPNASLFMLLHLSSVVDKPLLAKAFGFRILLPGASSLGQPLPSLACSRPALCPTFDASVSKYIAFFANVNHLSESHTSAMLAENLLR